MLENVKSKNIIKEIFRNMRNKRKLNIIKYNKRMLSRLNINKDQFENYIILKEFNQKYNINIEDIDIKQLNLKNKNIGNKGLKILFKIEFQELGKLALNRDKISDINILEKVNFKELKELDLSSNNLSKNDNDLIINNLKLKLKTLYV